MFLFCIVLSSFLAPLPKGMRYNVACNNTEMFFLLCNEQKKTFSPIDDLATHHPSMSEVILSMAFWMVGTLS